MITINGQDKETINEKQLADIAQELIDLQHVDANAELLAARGGLPLLNDRLNLEGDIKGTTQKVTYNADETIQKVEHIDSGLNVLRTDTFAYAATTVTEVRTLVGGATMTIVFHTDTYETEVI